MTVYNPLNADRADTGWRSLELQNDWNGDAFHRKVEDMVYLKGLITSIASADDDVADFTVTSTNRDYAPTFTAGATNIDYAPTFTDTDVDTTGDKITISTHGFANNDVVKFTASATLPAPFDSATSYHVVGKTTNDFQLSLTQGGGAIDITDAGTGPFTLTRQGDNFLNASGHTFANGDAVILTTSNTLPGGLLTATTYYIVQQTVNKFKLSLTLSGGEVDLSTAAGTGTHTATRQGDNYLNATSHPFTNGQRVQLTTTTTLPGGLQLLTDYYVRNKAVDKFQLSTTPTGSIFNMNTVAGSGTHTATAPNQTTVLADGTVLFTLPEESRPPAALTFDVVPSQDDSDGGNGELRLEVQTDGDVAVYNATDGGSGRAESISLAGISFATNGA